MRTIYFVMSQFPWSVHTLTRALQTLSRKKQALSELNEADARGLNRLFNGLDELSFWDMLSELVLFAIWYFAILSALVFSISVGHAIGAATAFAALVIAVAMVCKRLAQCYAVEATRESGIDTLIDSYKDTSRDPLLKYGIAMAPTVWLRTPYLRLPEAEFLEVKSTSSKRAGKNYAAREWKVDVGAVVLCVLLVIAFAVVGEVASSAIQAVLSIEFFLPFSMIAIYAIRLPVAVAWRMRQMREYFHEYLLLTN